MSPSALQISGNAGSDLYPTYTDWALDLKQPPNAENL